MNNIGANDYTRQVKEKLLQIKNGSEKSLKKIRKDLSSIIDSITFDQFPGKMEEIRDTILKMNNTSQSLLRTDVFSRNLERLGAFARTRTFQQAEEAVLTRRNVLTLLGQGTTSIAQRLANLIPINHPRFPDIDDEDAMDIEETIINAFLLMETRINEMVSNEEE